MMRVIASTARGWLACQRLDQAKQRVALRLSRVRRAAPIRGDQGHCAGPQSVFSAWAMVTHRSARSRAAAAAAAAAAGPGRPSRTNAHCRQLSGAAASRSASFSPPDAATSAPRPSIPARAAPAAALSPGPAASSAATTARTGVYAAPPTSGQAVACGDHEPGGVSGDAVKTGSLQLGAEASA